ncbi:Protein of uncharacterised function (DUF3710) [Mycobacteroides abscessus subsp. bolletii]|nr:Protein of uncharacterised function (DUF3710) [Mycobacteroides abscessus subsp. bolletii]
MFGMGKKKKAEQSAAELALEETKAPSPDAESTPTAEKNIVDEHPAFDRSNGPWDSSEKKASDDSYIDLGGLLIKSHPGLNLRLEADQKTQQVIAVTLQLGKGHLQVQAFAAPKSAGIWDDIRHELSESVRNQGGQVEINDGPLGRQLISRVPAQTADGRKGFRIARFAGVDGPRWFVRGVFSGSAVLPGESAEALEEVFRSIIVHRGSDPMAPRDLLPMRVPQSIQNAAEAQKAAQAQQGEKTPAGLEIPRRGPEITEIG